jgi:hypothetical protein
LLIYLILGNKKWIIETQLIEDFLINETILFQINEATFTIMNELKNKSRTSSMLVTRWNWIDLIDTKEDRNKYIVMIFEGYPAIFCKRCGIFVYKYFLNKIYILFLNLV